MDDLLASFLSCSRLRTPERDGCFISRTVTPHPPRNPPGSVISNWQRGDILIGRLHERRRYRRLWQRLRRENAPFRVVEGDIVISASAEIYDNMLLSCVTADWCSAARILAAAMTRSLNDSGRRAGDLVLFGRLRKLIDAGKLDARGDLATLRGSEVRLSSR